MQYMLLIYGDERRWASLSPDEERAIYDEYVAFTRELEEAGKIVGAQELQPTATATTVRVRDAETLVTDGPFAETAEALGGYYVIEAESLDEAVEWAAKIPAAREGAIEVRPLAVRNAEVPKAEEVPA